MAAARNELTRVQGFAGRTDAPQVLADRLVRRLTSGCGRGGRSPTRWPGPPARPRPAAVAPAPEPQFADDNDQELVLDELTREQVLNWRNLAAADHQLVFDHIDRLSELSAQHLSPGGSFPRCSAWPASGTWTSATPPGCRREGNEARVPACVSWTPGGASWSARMWLSGSCLPRRLHLRSSCAGRAYAPAMTTTPNPHTARQDQDPGMGRHRLLNDRRRAPEKRSGARRHVWVCHAGR